MAVHGHNNLVILSASCGADLLFRTGWLGWELLTCGKKRNFREHSLFTGGSVVRLGAESRVRPGRD